MASTKYAIYQTACELVAAPSLLDSDRTALLAAVIAQSDDIVLHARLADEFAWDGCEFKSSISDWSSLCKALEPPPLYEAPSVRAPTQVLAAPHVKPPSAESCRMLSDAAKELRDASLGDSERSAIFAGMVQTIDDGENNWLLDFELGWRFGYNGERFEPPIEDWMAVVRFLKPALVVEKALDGSYFDPWWAVDGRREIRSAEVLWKYVFRHDLCRSAADSVFLDEFLFNILVLPLVVSIETFDKKAQELTYPIVVGDENSGKVEANTHIIADMYSRYPERVERDDELPAVPSIDGSACDVEKLTFESAAISDEGPPAVRPLQDTAAPTSDERPMSDLPQQNTTASISDERSHVDLSRQETVSTINQNWLAITRENSVEPTIDIHSMENRHQSTTAPAVEIDNDEDREEWDFCGSDPPDEESRDK
ncbi:hypothetical protein HDU86_003665 [Geranomyces michiganensis]|nr:hypothetical protein HDU86_003665 [Geranomyces michiganensis]